MANIFYQINLDINQKGGTYIVMKYSLPRFVLDFTMETIMELMCFVSVL